MIKIKQQKIRIRTEKTGLTKKQKREAEKISKLPDSSPLLIALYLLGIFGIIMSVGETLLLTNNILFYLIVAGAEIFSFVLWYIYVHKNQFFLYLILAICGFSLLFIIPSWNIISQGFSQMYAYGGYSSSGSGYHTLEILSPIVMILVTLLLFYLEFVMRQHSILFLICLAIVVFGPLLGMTLSPLSLVLIVIFQFGFYVFNTKISRKKLRLNVRNNARTTAMSTAVTAVVLLISFIPSFIAEYIYEDDMFSQVYMADAFIQDEINELLGNFSTNVVDGSVSRGNLRQSGKPVFDIDLREKPDSRLYLKGFVGKDYDGSVWSPAYHQDGVIFQYAESFEEDHTNYARHAVSFYREDFASYLMNDAVQTYYNDLIEKISKLTGLSLLSVEFDQTEDGQQYTYLLDADSREVAVDMGVNYDISSDNSYISYTNAYIFKKGSTPLYGTRLTRAIEAYWSDPDTSMIESCIDFDINDIPAFPSILEPTNKSESIADIYTTFGKKDSGYNNVTHKLASSSIAETNSFCITPQNNSYQNVLYPYFAEERKAMGSFGTDNGTINERYFNSYYPQDSISMTKKWEDLPYYKQYVNNYMNIIQRAYLSHPGNDKLPRLTKICDEADFNKNNINEITTFILYTLQNNARYSKTPGSVPFNAETVEYFLFDNHQGYCVHFATAAALMYRMFGIPARYVTGYTVSPADLKYIDVNNRSEQKINFSYNATVSDKSAHAWVEIFLNDYGWVPIEVTPTLDGRMTASFPGFDQSVMTSIMDAHGWKFKKRNADGTAAEDNNINGDDNDLDLVTVLLIGTASAVILLAAGLFIRRSYLISMQKKMGCRRAFDRLIDLLHYGGLLVGQYGSEKNFAAELSESVPEITAEESQRLISILEAENFSAKTAEKEENEFVRNIYYKASSIIYAKIPWYKKPYFWLIKCYQ